MTSVPPADLPPPADTPPGPGLAGAGIPGTALRDDTIPLPDGGTGQRRARRLNRHRERRRLQARIGGGLIAGAALVALAALVVTGLHLSSTAHHPTAGPAGGASSALAPAMLVQADEAGRAVSILVLAPSPGNRGGSLVFVPPGTMTEVASLGLEPVGLALQVGGPDRLKGAVENLFGVTFGSVTALDTNQLVALVRPAGPLRVTIPGRVAQVADDGSVHVLFDGGPTTVRPEQVPTLLAARGEGTDLDRLARQQAFFDAWLARIHDDPGLAAGAPQPGLRAALDALARGTVEPRVVPVEQLGRAEDGTEQYKVQQRDLTAMVAAAFPGQLRSRGPRPQVQILNGTGALELDVKVASRLVPAGVEVKLTGNAASFDYGETQVVFYDAAKQPIAERVQRALGVGRLVLSRRPLDVVDVTVIVGKDFRSG
jgi:hypothetical protein